MIEITKDQIDQIQNEKFLQELFNGREVAEVLKIPSTSLAEMYKYALKLFKEEKYKDALDAFIFLNFLDQNNHDIWLGLGMSLQMSKRYEAAIIAYELAAIQEPENPVPYFYLAKCLFAIHDHRAALDAIEMAIEFSDGKVEYAELYNQARTAKDSLLRRQEG